MYYFNEQNNPLPYEQVFDDYLPIQTYLKIIYATEKVDYGKALYSIIKQEEICGSRIGSFLSRNLWFIAGVSDIYWFRMHSLNNNAIHILFLLRYNSDLLCLTGFKFTKCNNKKDMSVLERWGKKKSIGWLRKKRYPTIFLFLSTMNPK